MRFGPIDYQGVSSRPHPARRHLLVAAISLGLGVSVGLLQADSIVTTSVAASVGLVIVGAIALNELRRHRRRGLVSPLFLSGVFWAGFALIPLALRPAATALGLPQNIVGHELRNESALTSATGVYVLAFMLFALGHWAAERFSGRQTRRPAPLSRTHDLERRPTDLGLGDVPERFVILFLIITLAARTYLLLTNSLGFARTFDSNAPTPALSAAVLLSTLAPAAVALAIGWTVANRDHRRVGRWWRALVIVSSLFLVVTAVLSGFKGSVILEALPSVAVLILSGARVRLSYVLVGLTLFVVSFGAIEGYRQQAALDHYRGRSEPTSLVTFVAAGGALGELRSLSSVGSHYIGEYSHTVSNLAAIIEFTPSVNPHLGGGYLLANTVFFLPRSAFGASGPVELGRYVSVAYLGGNSLTSTPPTQPGELFLALGWFGVVAGELALGAISGYLWGAFGRARGYRFATYLALMPLYVNGGMEGSLLVRGALQIIVTMFVLRLAAQMWATGPQVSKLTPSPASARANAAQIAAASQRS